MTTKFLSPTPHDCILVSTTEKTERDTPAFQAKLIFKTGSVEFNTENPEVRTLERILRLNPVSKGFTSILALPYDSSASAHKTPIKVRS
jgi:hypothetical protein